MTERNEYDDAFEEAEQLYDEEFGHKIAEADYSDDALLDLTPEGGPDKEAMQEFAAAARSAANAEEAKVAFLKLGGKVSLALLKAAKKVILPLMLLFLASDSFAAEAQEFKLDLMPFLSKTSACSVVTQHKEVLLGACYAPIEWKWGSLNIGGIWDTRWSGGNQEINTKKRFAGYVGAIGIRGGKAFAWLWNKWKLDDRGVKVNFTVPSVEFGPMGGYIQQAGWIYGGFLAGKLPFGGVK